LAHRLPLGVSLVGDEVLPDYLGAADYPWITRVVDTLDVLRGKPRREVLELLRPTEVAAPPTRLAQLLEALRPVLRYETRASIDPRQVRLAVCLERARSADDRTHLLDTVAARLGSSAAAVECAMFADVASEQVLTMSERMLSASDLAALANQRLVRAILARSSQVHIELVGNSRAVVRQARLRGLIVTVDAHRASSSDASGAGVDGTKLTVSGPLSLFRQTSLYGRALGELVPQLAWCERFSLAAVVPFLDRMLRLKVTTGAPIFPSERPRPFDSDLERRFAREFARAAPNWRVIREPAPVDAGGAIIFPDFEIVDRAQPSRHFLVEIVGFWTADYLERKLGHLRRAKLPNLILCIDESRACDGAALPEAARVVRFSRNRIRCEDVLRVIGAA
jgi:uncharacterized protein